MDRWDSERAAVLRLADGRGKRVGPGVVDPVTAMRLAGFQTQQSCGGHAHRAANGPWGHVRPGDGETLEALRYRVATLLSSARSCRFAEHRCLAAYTVLGHETLQPALRRVQTVATWETSQEAPTVPSCGPRGGAGGRLPSTSRAGSHELDPRRDELHYHKAREVTGCRSNRGTLAGTVDAQHTTMR
jgi:hypothetical protein